MDMIAGFGRRELWTLLAWNEIKQKYRRSAVGPLWASLNFAIFVGTLGLLYSELFGQDFSRYFPHLLLGWLVWNFINQTTTEGCLLFSNMRAYIMEINIPLTTFIFVLLWRNIILFAFNFLVFAVAAFFLELTPGISWLYSAIGLLLIFVNVSWLSMLVAVVSARYHDLIEVIGNLLRIMFFITPILWLPGMERDFKIVLDFNPFFHIIDVFRANILGHEVAALSWFVSIGIAIMGWIFTAIMYSKYKNRIPFWV